MVLAVDQMEGKIIKFHKFPLDKKGNANVVTNKLISLGKTSSISIHAFSADHMAGKKSNDSPEDRSPAFRQTGGQLGLRIPRAGLSKTDRRQGQGLLWIWQRSWKYSGITAHPPSSVCNTALGRMLPSMVLTLLPS